MDGESRIDTIGRLLTLAANGTPLGSDIDALMACAIATEARGLDCPLGAMVIAEANNRVAAPGLRALRRAATRVHEGQARALGDRVFMDAVIDCCVSRRLGEACPLATYATAVEAGMSVS